MAINFGKYKTYDTSNGYGNPEQWKKFFESVFSGLFGEEIFTEEFKKEFEEKFSESKRNFENFKKVKINSSYFSKCSTKEELKSEFRKLMMANHPDIVGEQSTEKCKEIINEYNKVLIKFK